MAKLVFAMNVSLDGYVDHDRFAPSRELFLHWIEAVRDASGCLYGRRLYEIMRYWDHDDAGWGEDERAFATAWRKQTKWVVSQSLKSVGPNAILIGEDFEAAIRDLTDKASGEIAVGGPVLAQGLGDLGLIDEYRLYVHPVVLGSGRPFFVGPRPRLRFSATERIAGDVVRLSYLPA